MAGAGFKTFADGNVMSAAEVNTYLMQQSVMNFASPTARDTAITSPSEGMVVHCSDLGAPYVTIYDGTAWRAFDLVWQTYTPTWSASVTAPAIGNGTLSGWYRRCYPFTEVRLLHAPGSTTTQGDGTFTWSLPSGITPTTDNLSGYGTIYYGTSIGDRNCYPRYWNSTTFAFVQSLGSTAYADPAYAGNNREWVTLGDAAVGGNPAAAQRWVVGSGGKMHAYLLINDTP